MADNDYRRESDKVIYRLEGKVDAILDKLDGHTDWLKSHEEKIGNVEKEVTRLKTIVAIAGVILSTFLTGLIAFIGWFRHK